MVPDGAEMHWTNKKGENHKATFAAQITEPGEYRVSFGGPEGLESI